MNLHEITTQILMHPKSLWGMYVVIILVLFLMVTRFWVLLRRSVENKKQVFGMLDGHQRAEGDVLVEIKPSVLFPRYQELFLFCFSGIYWQWFLGLNVVVFGGILVGLMLGKLEVFSLVCYVLVLVFFTLFMFSRKQRVQKQLVEQFPLFLQGMSRSMQAGHTFESALRFIQTEVSDPLRSELNRLQNNLYLGLELAQALSIFAKKIDHETVYFFSESTVIQLETGANMVEMFEKIGTVIDEKLKLDRDIRGFTSQGKMSGILVAGLWPLSLLLFWWISPENVDVLFHTSPGQLLLGISLFLECLGFYFIWKIVSIKI